MATQAEERIRGDRRTQPGEAGEASLEDVKFSEGENEHERLARQAEEMLTVSDSRRNEEHIVENLKPGEWHGCVSMTRGITLRDAAGNITGQTEEWRCQCGAKFRGTTRKATEQLYLGHLREVDKTVPKR